MIVEVVTLIGIVTLIDRMIEWGNTAITFEALHWNCIGQNCV